MHFLLWVDAICINQSNSQEKSMQVLRMDEIYRRMGSPNMAW